MHNLWGGCGPQGGPAAPTLTHSRQLECETDMWKHWTAAQLLPDPRSEMFQVEPGLRETLEKQCLRGTRLATLRARVCADVAQLKEDLKPETELWWNALPPHVQCLYKAPETAIQVPVLEHLLRMFHWPDTELLGFSLQSQTTLGLHAVQPRLHPQQAAASSS